MSIIEIKDITKDYGNNKGVFDLSFNVDEGEVFGFLGPNGAGKTTTIRQLLGFLNSDKGSCSIFGLDCRTKQEIIQKRVGYLPGEIAFLDEMSGKAYLEFIAKLRGITDLTKMNKLIEMFEFDPTGRLRRMSKGMKQKIGIVAAFMHNPDVLILDEPTSGLDPLMQNRFVELIKDEQSQGKTILMSSHSFDEVEKTCNRVGIIKQGRLVSVEEIHALKSAQAKTYIIEFATEKEAIDFKKHDFKVVEQNENIVKVALKGEMSPLLRCASEYSVKSFETKTQTLEELFMHFYGGVSNDK